MTGLLIFLGVFGMWRVGNYCMRRKRQERKRAAEALYRLTGEGEMPDNILIEIVHAATSPYLTRDHLRDMSPEVLRAALPSLQLDGRAAMLRNRHQHRQQP